MKRQFFTYPLLFITAILFSACSIDSNSDINSNSNKGTLKVGLTDAPANFDQVNIEIRQVLVNKSEDAEPEENGEEGEGSDDENGWYSIMDDSITVNLLDYQNGAVLDLGEAELEAGQYNQIRLLLGSENNVVIDGNTYPLTTPSAQQSGYKLNVQADIEEGEVYELIIDFDASQSIVVTGNNRFILKPVLRAIDLTTQASISGTVLPLEADPFVYTITGEDTLGTQPNDDGDFKFVGLQEGSYDVWLNPTNELYADSLIKDIELESGEQFEFEDTIVLEDTTSSSE